MGIALSDTLQVIKDPSQGGLHKKREYSYWITYVETPELDGFRHSWI